MGLYEVKVRQDLVSSFYDQYKFTVHMSINPVREKKVSMKQTSKHKCLVECG